VSDLKTRLQRHMQVLCGDIGERHLGSPGEARAAEYLAGEFAALGYPVVREEFNAPGWTYGRYGLSLAATGEVFPCFPCFYSNACEVTGKLFPFDLRDTPHLAAEAGAPREAWSGRICLARGRFGDVGDTNTAADILDALGAAAMIVTSPYRGTVSTKIVRNPDPKKLAVVTISQATTEALSRHLDEEVTLFVEARNFPTVSWNVVGRKQGAPGARKVVIGAHYDTSPGIQGAWDNATGTAVVLELARLLAGKTGDCAVDFIAFGGEEFGGKVGAGLGGYCYANDHAGEWDRIAWMGCVDGVGACRGRLKVGVGGSDALRERVQRVCDRAGVKVGGFLRGSDNNIFNARGIPNVLFCEEDASGSGWPVPLHSVEDSLEQVDPDRLTSVCELASSTFEDLFRAVAR
jgi:aminopeptidase YwaD